MPEFVNFLKVVGEIITTIGLSTFILIVFSYLAWKYYPNYKNFVASVLERQRVVDEIKDIVNKLRDDCANLEKTLSVLLAVQEASNSKLQDFIDKLLEIIKAGSIKHE